MKIRSKSCWVVGILVLMLLVPGCKKAKVNSDNEGPKSNPITEVRNQGAGPAVGAVLPSAGRVVVLNDMDEFAKWYFLCATDGTPPASMDALAKDPAMGSLYNKLKESDIEVYWGANPNRPGSEPGNTILAYSKDAVAKNKPIPVALLNGKARVMTKQEFDSASKPGK